jgi:hypothetical protein
MPLLKLMGTMLKTQLTQLMWQLMKSEVTGEEHAADEV